MSPILVAGPTASGKSAVALELARRVGGEILCADSMQVYRGMDIGTAKVTHERAGIPHHLLDLVEVSEEFSAGRWLEAARQTEQEVRTRGSIPIYCGGTGLYFQILLEGLDPVPPPDPILRRELEALPVSILLEELERTAPDVFTRIDRQNPRRILRAVEIQRWRACHPAKQEPHGILEDTAPIGSAGFPSNEGPPVAEASGDARAPIFALRRDPADLRARLDSRVDAMFQAGLMEETQRLLDRGLASNRTAMQAIGYRQVVEHLQGVRDLPSTIQLVKQKTWQYARRQMTWFRHRPCVVWVDAGEHETERALADRILAHPAIGMKSH